MLRRKSENRTDLNDVNLLEEIAGFRYVRFGVFNSVSLVQDNTSPVHSGQTALRTRSLHHLISCNAHIVFIATRNLLTLESFLSSAVGVQAHHTQRGTELLAFGHPVE